MMLRKKEVTNKIKVCMVVPDPLVKGGIASVANGYRGSKLEEDFDIIYVESYRDGSKLQKFIKAIQAYFRYIKIIIRDQPDLIHIHSSFGPSFYRKAPFIYISAWSKRPVLNHIHGAEFDDFYTNAPNWKKKWIERVYGKCKVLIALSEEWKEKLKRIVPEERIVVIENYSTLHEDALEQRVKRASSHKVLFLGELGKRKGCYDIPDVMEQVVKNVVDVEFVLAGAGSLEDESAIKGLISEKGLSEHVRFPGWVRGDEKDQLLREADVFFLPSYNEGMPMSILDAMGYGLPVVSTTVGGIPKLIQDGENGYCCQAGDMHWMAKRIAEIIENEEIRRKFSKASMCLSREKYSLKHHIVCLEKVYIDISKSSRRKEMCE